MEHSYVTPASLVSKTSLLSIREFSEMSGIEQSTLRYWESIGLFMPTQRNSVNGFRYYLPEQLITVNFIKVFKSLQVSLKDLSEYAANRSPELILSLINRQQEVLKQKLHQLQEAVTAAWIYQCVIQQALDVPDFGAVYLQRLEPFRFFLGPRNHADKDGLFYPSLLNYYSYASENNINLNNPIGGYWESMARFLENPSHPDAFFSLDPNGSNECAAGEYLVGFAQGFYGEKGDAPQRIAAHAKENAIQLNGPVYELYAIGEICEKDPCKYMAQISVRLTSSSAI